MSATKILWGQITVVFLIVLFTTWTATQWTAYRLGFQPQLGHPWFELMGWPVYYPPAFFWWWYFYDAYAPPIFVEGAYIAASGGFISIAVAIATNDERTAKRVSDALGTATEMKAMKNYAGHRLSPWLGHLMVSRSETARPLLTPGEVMQLPPADEIVMVAGTPPIRAKKARYYEDARFKERVLLPPDPAKSGRSKRTDGWSALKPQTPDAALLAKIAEADAANSGLRREPELPDHVAIAKETTDPSPADEFAITLDDEPEDAARQSRILRQQMRGVARQVSLDPNDGMDL